MAPCNTIFSQMLEFVSRDESETLAKQHHAGRPFRTASRWSLFVTPTVAQLSGRSSLRDSVKNIYAQFHRLYHLCSVKLCRSNLSRINEDKLYRLYETLFGKQLNRSQRITPGYNYCFRKALCSLDASIINLCLSVFSWADFRTTKGAINLHVGLRNDGYLPEFVTITGGKMHYVTIGCTLQFPEGSIVAIDRGCDGYTCYKKFTDKGIFFVIRLKSNAKMHLVSCRPILKIEGRIGDQTIEFIDNQIAKKYSFKLRQIGCRNSESGKHYTFLTNNFKLSAKTIAYLYKARWQMVRFFRWIKQNLKITSFIGTNKYAVRTQFWIALCVHIILACIKFQSKLNKSTQQTLRLLLLNLFVKLDIMALRRGAHLCDNIL